MRAKEEERWRVNGWWSNWNTDQPNKTWTEEEVQEEHKGTARTGSNHGEAAKAQGIWRWTEKKSPRIMKTKNTDLLTHAGRGLAGGTGPQSTLTIGGHPSMYWRGTGQAIGSIRNGSDRDRNQHGPEKPERNGTNRHGSLKQGSDRCSLGSNRARHFTFHI